MRFYDIGENPLMGLSEKHIAPLVLGGIIAAGASLAGNAIGSASQNKTNQTSIDINRENNAFNAQQSQIQRDWQEKMWGMNNSYNSPNAMIWISGKLLCMLQVNVLIRNLRSTNT